MILQHKMMLQAYIKHYNHYRGHGDNKYLMLVTAEAGQLYLIRWYKFTETLHLYPLLIATTTLKKQERHMNDVSLIFRLALILIFTTFVSGAQAAENVPSLFVTDEAGRSATLDAADIN